MITVTGHSSIRWILVFFLFTTIFLINEIILKFEEKKDILSEKNDQCVLCA
jgi:hypothetical protein